MFTRKSLLISSLGLTVVTVLLAVRQPDNWIIVSDRLFLYGMVMLLLAAAVLLFSGKFGFAVFRGFRLLFKGTPIAYEEDDIHSYPEDYSDPGRDKPASTIGKGTWFMLIALLAGLANVLFSIILILLFR